MPSRRRRCSRSDSRRRPGVAGDGGGSAGGSAGRRIISSDGAGADHLRLAEVGERAAEAVAVGPGRAGRRELLAHGAQEAEQLLVLHEVELADHAELVERVEEEVHEGQVGLQRLLPLRPAPDLGGRPLDGGLGERRHRVGDHQGRDAVGEVLVDLLERGAQLRRRVGPGGEGGAERAGRGRRRPRRRRPRERPPPRPRPPTPPAAPAASPRRPRSAPRGAFASARITTVARPGGRSGATSASGTGSRWATANRTAGMVGPVNGRFPESIS